MNPGKQENRVMDYHQNTKAREELRILSGYGIIRGGGDESSPLSYHERRKRLRSGE